MEKPARTYKMTLDLSEQLRADLDAMAKQEHRSIKGQMMWCLERCVSRWQRAQEDLE